MHHTLIVSFIGNTQQFARVIVTMETALPQTSAPVILVGLEICVEPVIKFNQGCIILLHACM